jgi:hypothetical protein
MRYLIECRPTPLFFGEKIDEPRSLLINHGLLDVVLFGYSFSADARLDDDSIQRIISEVQADPDFSNQIQIDIDRVEIKEGSVEILILASSVVAPAAAPAVVGIGAAGLAVWAADKLFGGVLSEFGKRIAGRILNVFPKKEQGEIFSPAEHAEKLAWEAAKDHGCDKVAIMEGGVRTGATYRYKYRLFGGTCSIRGITIWVDPKGQEEAELCVWE